VVTNRKLDGYLCSLYSAKGNEESMWEMQSLSHDHVNTLIQETINGYNNIGDGDPIQHEDRIKWINEKLSKRIKP
jgi:hypothetical protein